MMDGMDGFKFGEIIKRNPSYSHIPLLYLTAKSRNSNELNSLKLGALDFVEKPFKLPVLLEKVRTIIENSRSLNQALIEQIQSSFHLHHNGSQPACLNAAVDLTASYEKYYLTKQEIKVVELINNGHTNVEIGQILNISSKTVMTHVRNIFKKVGVKRRGDLVKKLSSSH